MVEGSNVIRSSDLIKPAGSNIITPAQTPGGSPTINMGEIRSIVEMIKGGLETVKEIQKMRTDAQNLIPGNNQQASDGFTGPAPAQTPTAPSSNNPPQVVEKVIYKKVEIDKEKLKAFLKALIVEEGQKLPDDLKEKKLSDLTGENFDQLKIKIKKYGMNIEANGDQILDVICDQMIKTLPALEVEAKQ